MNVRHRQAINMNNHIRMEYMHLLPWRRLVKENGDEELGLDDDNVFIYIYIYILNYNVAHNLSPIV